jgi:hypothetical protein
VPRAAHSLSLLCYERPDGPLPIRVKNGPDGAQRDFRDTPESRHPHCSSECLKGAISGISMTDRSVVSGRRLLAARAPADSASVERHFGKWHKLHPSLLETFAHHSRQLDCGRLVAMNA